MSIRTSVSVIDTTGSVGGRHDQDPAATVPSQSGDERHHEARGPPAARPRAPEPRVRAVAPRRGGPRNPGMRYIPLIRGSTMTLIDRVRDKYRRAESRPK